ncbi:2f6799c9-b1c3-449a-b05c-c080e78bd61e [Thermothielavioides terrestris]|uniref:2f6799c9-b1c3-449a-b05c-c080e78bd61e n=1 Tax=Thermothielavioides terrestris TaxID=2587410 RepID=A0A446BYW7_9PEZI|nr:2f6799c9-b1c3-449a-b05c-c080e78bd61e [Thermothielavioides terrestris]
MDAASIVEINKVRLAMGMKPLPVPGAAPPPKEPTPEKETGDDGRPVSTLETREAAGVENFRKVQEAAAAKRKREEKAAAIKKARELAQRSAVVAGKGLADDDDDEDLDVKSWLKNQKKRQKKIEAARKAEEEKAAAEAAKAAAAEHTAADLAGVKVAHDMASFLGGDDQILTLKDAGVLENEEEGDELENLELREQEKLQERLDLKKKRPVYDPNEVDETGEIGVLSKYDEEIYGKKKKAFTLDSVATKTELADILEAPAAQRRKHQVADLDALEEAPAPTSDYLDPSEVKVKKPKKKKSKSTRRRREDDDDVLFAGDAADGEEAAQEMEVDSGAPAPAKKRKVVDDGFVDDEDLQSSLALQRREALKKRKKTRPEDIAKQLREAENADGEAEEDKGAVMDEISRFVDGLRAEAEEERKPRRLKSEEAVTNMKEESSEDEEMRDADHPSASREATPLGEVPVTGVEEEKTVDQGLGATLALLRERHLIEEGRGAELNEKFRQRQRFLNELRRRMDLFDQETRAQRERDRASGRLDRMSAREREEWQRQQNTIRDQHQSRVIDQLFREGYRPDVELKYVDGDGRRLDAKEAFKELSHQFHGKGSGKGKTDKRLKKLAEEKRRMAQSMLDASQNVGMSSAASHQIKKRREAGVRLA